ncbi:hypothetical protein [Desulforhopalus sp. 52FAK]
MKIAATMVSMDAARNYTEVDQTNTIMQQGQAGLNSINQPRSELSGQSFQQDFFSLIHSSTSTRQSGSFSVSTGSGIEEAVEVPEKFDQNLQSKAAISSMVELVAGTSVNIQQTRGISPNRLGSSPSIEVGSASLSSSVVHFEEESVFFQAAGEVQTEDGRSISFNLGLQMERQELLIQSAGMGSIFGIDPLVLNFDDTISIFDENYFSFDLDGDGEKEELSTLGSCCGFLALDRNGDGSINNGLELFGPSTDSGFGELADLDYDGNSWIDENDPIFDDLMIWQGAGGEDEHLISLREAGVGAISVSNLGTQFNLEDQDGTVQGIVQASGMFLMENGEPKSMLEIDMVPRNREIQDSVPDINGGSNGQLETTAQADIISSISEKNQSAMDDLRQIIFWQRMKMQLYFGSKMLNSSHNEMVERLEHLTTQLKSSMLS